MGKTDVLTITTRALVQGRRDPTISTMLSGGENILHDVKIDWTDGTGDGQVTVILTGAITVPVAGAATVSFANADPYGTMGDDVPSGTVEALSLKFLLIQNLDDTNYITIGEGAAPLPNFLGGTSPTLYLGPSSYHKFTWYKGTSAINDTSDDELTLLANTADCSAKLTAGFG